MFRGFVSMSKAVSQRMGAICLLRANGIVRLSEFRNMGITAAAISRMVKDGAMVRPYLEALTINA